MVLDQKHALEPERLGLDDVVDEFAVDLAIVRLLSLGGGPAEQTETHCKAPIAAPEATRPCPWLSSRPTPANEPGESRDPYIPGVHDSTATARICGSPDRRFRAV